MSTKHGLTRSLKHWDTFTLSFGAMIGWSWVALVSEVIGRSGTMGALIATAAVGLVIIALGLIYGELAAAMPDVGGEHVYSLRALGVFPSFVCTWAIVFAYVSVTAFEAIALPTVLENLFPSLGNGRLWLVSGTPVFLDHALIGAFVSLLIMYINVRGVKIAAFIQSVVVVVIVCAGLVLFTGAGINGDMTNMQPLLPNGMKGILAAAAMIPFFMVGFDVIPQAAEEIDLEPRKIGSLIVWSIGMAVIWYLLIELSVGMLLDHAARGDADLATITAAGAAWGREGAVILLIGGVAGILTSWNGFMVGGSRALFALAESGMLPGWLAKVHPRYHTPSNAIIFIGIMGVVAPFLGRQALIWFVDAGSFGLMIAYLFVALSFIVLRQREPELVRPFVAPVGRFIGWFGMIASLAMAALYLPGMPAALVWPHEWLMVIIWFAGGTLAFHFSYRRILNRPI